MIIKNPIFFPKIEKGNIHKKLRDMDMLLLFIAMKDNTLTLIILKQ